jgi:hypothetical protein
LLEKKRVEFGECKKVQKSAQKCERKGLECSEEKEVKEVEEAKEIKEGKRKGQRARHLRGRRAWNCRLT